MLVPAALGLLVGLVIGGLGGGGGVLTVPVLVYLLGQTAQDATTGSVVIVGAAALVGAVARVRVIAWRTGIGFGAVGIPAAYLGSWLNHRVEQPVLLLVFAALTLVAAAAMLHNDRAPGRADPAVEPSAGPAGPGGVDLATRQLSWRAVRLRVALKIVFWGAAAGFLTGFLGVGGGFLVVPVLVVVLRMPMFRAIGTSLLIIVLNAVASLGSRLGGLDLDWAVVGPFAAAAIAGTLLGKLAADRCSGPTLTRAFAGMLVLVGLFVGVESGLALF